MIPETLFDIAGHALGRPQRVVEIRRREDLFEALEAAKREGRPVVAMGQRTSYWHNLDLQGAICLDLTPFCGVLGFDREEGTCTVESGISVRVLDRALRAEGCFLPIHPDAFGDTTVGAALANGVSAGVGMVRGEFASQVRGFQVLLADGTLVEVGASRMLGARPGAIAHGLPDLRSLFVGAEGALGIVTEIDVALIPVEWEARITVRADRDRFDEVLSLARVWRWREGMSTVRWVWQEEGELFLQVGAGSEDELLRRIEVLTAELAPFGAAVVERASERERRGELPEYERKWPGPSGATWERGLARPFAGLDGVLSYRRASEGWRWARGLRIGETHGRRVAAYFGRDGMNLGIHCAFGSSSDRDRGRALLEAELPAFSELGAVPYRSGLAWLEHVRARLEPGTEAALTRVARALDPTSTFNPSVGILGRRSLP